MHIEEQLCKLMVKILCKFMFNLIVGRILVFLLLHISISVIIFLCL